MQNTLRSLWPSFLVASGATGIIFTLFDPVDVAILGNPVPLSRLAAYSVGFLSFWAIGVASSALTFLLLKSASEVNRPMLAGVPATRATQEGLDRKQ